MAWFALVLGVVLGYFCAVSTVPASIWAILTQLPQAQNKVDLAVVFGVLIGVYAVMLYILDRLAVTERATYDHIDENQRSSFMSNLRRRGSIGNFEFLHGVLPYGTSSLHPLRVSGLSSMDGDATAMARKKSK